MKITKLLCLFLLVMLITNSCKKKSTWDTSLHQAAWSGDIEKVKKLIARWANVNAKDWSGDTPLHKAARIGHTNIAELLIKRGAYVNPKGFKDNTPLHNAARGGYEDVSRLLIAYGADPNIQNEDGDTPIALPSLASLVDDLAQSGRGLIIVR